MTGALVARVPDRAMNPRSGIACAWFFGEITRRKLLLAREVQVCAIAPRLCPDGGSEQTGIAERRIDRL